MSDNTRLSLCRQHRPGFLQCLLLVTSQHGPLLNPSYPLTNYSRQFDFASSTMFSRSSSQARTLAHNMMLARMAQMGYFCLAKCDTLYPMAQMVTGRASIVRVEQHVRSLLVTALRKCRPSRFHRGHLPHRPPPLLHIRQWVRCC